jgi:hypothetical protein
MCKQYLFMVLLGLVALAQSLKGILLKCVCSVVLELLHLRFIGYSIGDFSNKTIAPPDQKPHS